MDRKGVIAKIEEEKLIVILRGVAKEALFPTVEAMIRGGVRLLEITYDAEGTPSDEETAENVRLLTERYGDVLTVGAGTVMTEKQVELTAEAGGRFVISPDVSPEVIRKTRECGLVSIPGALTPTEIRTAHDAGADFVKIFPISFFGPSYLKAVGAPLSGIRFLAVGGVGLADVPGYLAAGAAGFGISSSIADLHKIAAGDFASVEEAARAFVRAVKGQA